VSVNEKRENFFRARRRAVPSSNTSALEDSTPRRSNR
jgi:hypothetical protein